MAEPVCGTADWNAAARLPGSCSDLWGAASAAGSDRVFPLLQSDANAPLVGQGCSARSINPATGSDRCCAGSLRTASLLFADMIFRRDNRLTVAGPTLLSTSRKRLSVYFF